MTIEELAAVAVNSGLEVHRRLGPGLLESAYERVLAHLRQLGLLMKFSGERFSHGLKRIVNNHRDTSASRLDIHQ